jgi:hypothetical protein
LAVPEKQRIPADLHNEIKTVCDMMLNVHYYEPANWLWMAVSAPQACQSPVARAALAEARQIAAEFGFARVAKWADGVLA